VAKQKDANALPTRSRATEIFDFLGAGAKVVWPSISNDRVPTYRDIARRHSVSRHALWRHRAHVSLHTAPALATVMEIKTVLDEAWTAPNWNVSLLKIREAHHHLEELVVLLNSTVPLSRGG
jgi:hypothetical protein